MPAKTTPLIGIGITSTPNRKLLKHTIARWQRQLPYWAKLVMHEDKNLDGILVAKNKLLNKLAGCFCIFLADDNTYSIKKDWM